MILIWWQKYWCSFLRIWSNLNSLTQVSYVRNYYSSFFLKGYNWTHTTHTLHTHTTHLYTGKERDWKAHLSSLIGGVPHHFGNLVFLPLFHSAMVILPLFFNFVILPSLYSNEAPVYPFFVTPSKIVGLTG